MPTSSARAARMRWPRCRGRRLLRSNATPRAEQRCAAKLAGNVVQRSDQSALGYACRSRDASEQRDLTSEPERAAVVFNLIRRPIAGHCITVNDILIEQVPAFHQDAYVR